MKFLQGKGDQTPLHLAAQEGHLELIQLLVEQFGADINYRVSVQRKTQKTICKVHMLIDFIA
jgi:ankyrin repeat protein